MRALALVLCAIPSVLRAQTWDDPAAKELVGRAIERRAQSFADSSLKDWSAQAHGFVFFLGQIGEGLAEPPRLIKADQLELQVYWRLPNQSKQRIIGWRDRRDLPTDINYHRDHLGIAMNNFPNLIRLGEGDEVRDVPHPVSPAGDTLYEFALADSLTIAAPGRELRVYEVKFRPKDFKAPRIIGSVFFEVATADMVRMSFSFTRAAYLDDQLEDITVSIENSLWGGRWWLPLRQELEIRRRATFMDFPARGIIRGRFEIDGYRFNQGLDSTIFARGPEIVTAPLEVRDTFHWRDSIEIAIRDVAQPATLKDFDEVRAEATAIAMGHVLTGLRQNQIAGNSISDFVHVNRVEGLALHAGGAFRSGDEARQLRVSLGAGTATGLVTGGADLTARRGAMTWHIGGAREVREMGDFAVISKAVNSLVAQEAGRDFGDYYLASGGSLGFVRSLGGRSAMQLDLGYERIDSLQALAHWSHGLFARANPGADAGDWGVARLELRRHAASFATARDLTGRLDVEGGDGPTRYARVYGELRWQASAGATTLLLRAAGGAATAGLPRQRTFLIGGRGSLLGEPFHGLGGRRMFWTSAEWQLPLKIPEIKMGSFAGTGDHLTLAPNVGVGWVGGAIAGLPAVPTAGVDVALGLGASWLHDLLRFDVGYGLKSRQFGFAIDVSRSFWGIL
ncbi:MAG TPA: hypothetical protein VGI92_04915 [Gemmatimonadales bacterium]|jgi:hypothetical protein